MSADPKYEIREAKDGTFYYVLVAANGEVLATSETYPSREHAERGVVAAKCAAAQAST
ncbi:MAG TPA: YegP family protein [Solirubrobacterales bacterium]|nr:YegP family protein [Solirubrobacterales bacterium]